MKQILLSQWNQVGDLVRKTRSFFENTLPLSEIHKKGPADFVTETDYRVQNFLFNELSACWPEIQFMGEEKNNREIDFDGFYWILDPVDGTTNLIHRYQHSTVSLALAHGKTVLIGIIYNPDSDELFSAALGKGAFLNGTPIHVSTTGSLDGSLISIGTSPYNHEYADWNFVKAKEVFLRCQDIRRLGSAALELAYVACGRSDGMYEQRLYPWDYAAGLLLIQEAGGAATDFSGLLPDCSRPSSILATNGSIHQELMKLLE